MSISLATLTDYLDAFLRIAEVPDEPNALNGLQVEQSGPVNRLVAAVDASLATIRGVGAGREGSGDSPLLLVHHGLFWDGNVPLTGRRAQRVRALIEGRIAVYAAHIPLDVHPEVGNNTVLARQLGLQAPAFFDSYRGIPIGVQGILDPPESRESLLNRLARLLGGAPRLIPGGPELVCRIGVITGAAGGRIAAAKAAGVDTYITGEGAHHTFFDAMELGLNVVYAGHYATETVGIKALAAHLSERFGIPWEFHDHPTGL